MASCRILLVEDHVETAAVLSRLLKISGHDVSAAETARGALDLAGQRAFDLLLIDLGLPDLDGRALLPRLREVSVAPAIALTGYDIEADGDSCTAAGFVGRLVKPISFESLLASVNDLCPAQFPPDLPEARPAACP
jgi:two-component system CheB/CheR fusion protein